MLFDVGNQELGVKWRIVRDQNVITAEFRKCRQDGIDQGFTLNHVIRNTIHRRSPWRNRAKRINQSGKDRLGLAIDKTNGTDFYDLIYSRNCTSGL